MKKEINDINNLKIENSVEYLENIISLLPGHVYWKDRNGVLMGCNDEQAKDLGLKSRHDVVGLTAFDTLPMDLAERITKFDNEVMDNGLPKTIEEILILPNGEKTVWLSRKVPLFHEKKVVGLLGISIDVTEITRTKKELKKTKHKLDAMTAVSFSLAHELRTPLSSLEMNVSSLSNFLPLLISSYKIAQSVNAPVPEIPAIKLKPLTNLVENMKLSIKSAFNFIDMLLIKIRPSVSAKSHQTFSMVNCVNDALAHYPFLGNQRELIKINCQEDFLVQGESLLVVHVFYNLLKNALYYIEAAGKGDINIKIQKHQDKNKIFFKDTGMGISAKILPHIFKRFYSKTYHGAGIGLTFCKMVMQSLGGSIKCQSIEGEYTEFILSFPLAK